MAATWRSVKVFNEIFHEAPHFLDAILESGHIQIKSYLEPWALQ